MKKYLFYVLLILISIGTGWFLRQIRYPPSNAPMRSAEAQLLVNIREKCKMADIKGEIYFKKYGAAKSNDESLNSKEWVDAQSWEQACSDAFQELREQFRAEK